MNRFFVGLFIAASCRFCLRHNAHVRRCCRGEYVGFIHGYSVCLTDSREAHHQFCHYSHYGRCLLFVGTQALAGIGGVIFSGGGWGSSDPQPLILAWNNFSEYLATRQKVCYTTPQFVFSLTIHKPR